MVPSVAGFTMGDIRNHRLYCFGHNGDVPFFNRFHKAPSDARVERIVMPLALYAPRGAEPISLRPLSEEDEEEWNAVRFRNDAWLRPWESADPMHGQLLTYRRWIEQQRLDEAHGTGALFAISYKGKIVGQISLGAIFNGSIRSGIVGYWIDQQYAGRGFMPLAVCMLADWAMLDPEGPQLHRLEIDIVPTNSRSLRVVEKIGASYEGTRRKYMYINGEWMDHRSYSLLREDTKNGFVADLLSDTPKH